MSDPVIRLLAIDDLEAALGLSRSAGWNQRPEDWRMLLELAPAGSFAALIDGRIVGTAIGIDYARFGWIAMMLVDPAHRGRGVGRRLLEAAMGAVPSDRPIRLDATPLGRPLYERYGFSDEALIIRYAADGSSARIDPEAPSSVPFAETRLKPRATRSSRVQRLKVADLQIVSEQDREVFGGDRRAVLEWALGGAPQYAQVVRDDAGSTHYCLGREGRLFDQIGPVVADADDIAQALVNAALVAAGDRSVVVDAFDARSGFTAWLGSRGFQAQRPLFRMGRPARDAVPASTVQNRLSLVEFAILGPEFA